MLTAVAPSVRGCSCDQCSPSKRMSRWPNSAPLSEGPGGAGVSTPAYSGLRMHDALGFTIDPCGKRKQPVGKVTAPGPTWPLREIRKAIICRLSQELGSAIFRVTLEEA